MEEYLEKFGQESGIWIYKENGAALIVNWSSVDCNGREPVVFYGALVWLPPACESSEWVKTAADVNLDEYIIDNVGELVYDANNDALDGLEGMSGDVWETDNYIVLVPRGWN